MGKHDYSRFRTPTCDKCGADFVYKRRDIEAEWRDGFIVLFPKLRTFSCPNECDGPDSFVVSGKTATFMQESYYEEYAKYLEKQEEGTSNIDK